MSKNEIRFGMGNEAIAEGAIAAGARFYAGYPITPSTEVAEISSVRLPQVGGTFVQMEDELGSMGAIIGGSAAGVKSFTATSGPGLSLMQENIGMAVMSEVPCVIVDVQRCGPSTGVATRPAQADVMAARWGSHGDHSIIAIAPSSVQECFDHTVTAFNLAERYRTPVIILADEVIGHLREQFEIHPVEVVDRKVPDESVPGGDYAVADFAAFEDGIVPMPPFGSKYVTRLTSSLHNEYGFGINNGPKNSDFVRHLVNKIEDAADDIVITESFNMEDAEYVIVTFGASVRSAMAAMTAARAEGLKVGLLKLVTIWPFANKQVTEVLKTAKAVFVPEMNLGQIRGEVDKLNTTGVPVIGINYIDNEIIRPSHILEAIKEVAN